MRDKERRGYHAKRQKYGLSERIVCHVRALGTVKVSGGTGDPVVTLESHRLER
jgi:hypothetical protein